MAYLVKRVYTRPATNISFFGKANPARVTDIAPVLASYKDSGKLLTESSVVSEDNLTQTYSALWVSKAEYEAYLTNPTMSQFFTERRTYHDANGVTVTETKTEI